LHSVKDVADDIVVVDSFSTDKTKEICLRNGARFVEHKFNGHIEQKNFAITQAKFPFILSLDADEALDNALIESIQDAKAIDSVDGFYMNRLTNYCGQWIKHSGWYPDRKLRLWDSSKGQWTGINPHDRYELREGSCTELLKGDILHYSYYTIEDHYRQLEYFTNIASKAYFEKGKKSSFVKLVFNPALKFVSCYIFKFGFLDGINGWRIARISAYATYLKYAKLKDIWRNSN
jgi:glycosyltransferase involved in cell wall biosynthesis